MVHDFIRSVQKLPRWAEAVIVLGGTFGWFAVVHWTSPDSPDVGSGPVEYTDAQLLGLIFWEIGALIALALFMWIRGWRMADFAIPISRKNTITGFKLWLLSLGIYWVVGLASLVVPEMRASAENLKFTVNVSWLTIIVLSIVNPIYEEVITVLYLFKRLDFMRPAALIVMSASLRGMVHAYQGAFAMIMIAVMGIVFAAHFAKYRQLWPLIVAHAIMDFFGLALGSSD